ncbi:MAG: AAA family ATPase [Phycisphaerae bacterium]
MSDAGQLERLLVSGHRVIAIDTLEESYALGIVREVALRLARPLWVWDAVGGVREGLLAASPRIERTDDPVQALGYLGTLDREPLIVMLDLAAHLPQARPLRALRDLPDRLAPRGGQLILIDHDRELPAVIATLATRLELSLPSDVELHALVRDTLRRCNEEQKIEIQISRRGLDAIVKNLGGLTRRQAERIIRDTVSEDRRFDDADIDAVLAGKRRALGGDGLLQFVESPATLDDLGGLARLKRWLVERANVMSDAAREFGLEAPRGVLMLGVQGAGKSLCAKAISTAWRRPLLRLDVGALYDRYVGESERRLRMALQQAEAMAPIVLWIDEIEKAFASAAAQSSDGGLSRRMFGTLLTWMQEHDRPVFLAATANDIEALPPELLRKGRFDEIFFVDLPSAEVRAQIFAIHLRRRKRDPAAFALDRLAAQAEGFSGAEIEQAVRAALQEAFPAGAALDTARLEAVIRRSPPLAVTMAERVAALRAWAAGRCTPAD